MKLNKLVSTLNMEHSTWLKYRRKGVGGSDAGSICGLNPYSTAIAVFQDKVQQLELQCCMIALASVRYAVRDLWMAWTRELSTLQKIWQHGRTISTVSRSRSELIWRLDGIIKRKEPASGRGKGIPGFLER